MNSFLSPLNFVGAGPWRIFEARDALFLDGRQAAREDALADERDGHGEVERGDGRPLAGAFLAGGVEDLVHHGLAVVVLLGEDLGGDLDEEAVELALVPLAEDRGEVVRREAEAVLEELVGLADELHVAILDAVVHHLDVVARAALADPVAAGSTVFDLCGDGLEDGLDCGPSRWIAAGHDGGAEARALFAAGYAGADVVQALLREFLRATVGVGVERVAAVDDDVALFEERNDGCDVLVYNLAGLDHDHDATGSLEFADQLLNGVRAFHQCALGLVGQKVIDLGGGAIEDCNFVAMVVHVQNEVLPHYCQPNQADVTTAVCHSVSCPRLTVQRGVLV